MPTTDHITLTCPETSIAKGGGHCSLPGTRRSRAHRVSAGLYLDEKDLNLGFCGLQGTYISPVHTNPSKQQLDAPSYGRVDILILDLNRMAFLAQAEPNGKIWPFSRNPGIFMSTQTTERCAPHTGTALSRESELLIQIVHFTQ